MNDVEMLCLDRALPLYKIADLQLLYYSNTYLTNEVTVDTVKLDAIQINNETNFDFFLKKWYPASFFYLLQKV